MALIREDCHGIYVKADGSIFRPQVNRYHGHLKNVASKYRAGEKVRARHIPQTTRAKVGDEFWFGHGSYDFWDPAVGKFIPIPSEKVWDTIGAEYCDGHHTY